MDSEYRKGPAPVNHLSRGAEGGMDGWEKEKPAPCYPPAGDSRSTLADGALNFRVRNGNGCDNPSLGTGIRWDQLMALRRGSGELAPPALVGRLPDESRDDRRTRGSPCASGKRRKRQAARGISTGRVNTLPCLRPQPIEVVVYDPP